MNVVSDNLLRGLSGGVATHASKFAKYHSRSVALTTRDCGFIPMRVEGRFEQWVDCVAFDVIDPVRELR